MAASPARATLARLERHSTRLAWALLAVEMVIAAAGILWLQRGLTFVPDELVWIQLSGAAPFSHLLDPYVGHLIVANLLAFKAVLHLFGTDYRAFGAFQAGGLLLCAGLMFEYARRRVGPILALAPATVLLFLGGSWNILLQPLIGAQWMYSLGFGLGALLALERSDLRGDVIACGLLCLSLSWFTSGLAFLAGAAVSVLLSPRRWRRAWIIAVPLVPYAVWRIWAMKFVGSGFSAGNIPLAPLYVVDAIAAAGAGIFGRTQLVGKGPATSLHLNGFDLGTATTAVLVLAIEAVAVVIVLRRLRRRGGLPASLWVALAVAAALWITESLGLAVNRAPGENRYLFAGALVLLLVVVECARGVRLSRAGVAVVLGIAALAAAGNAPRFREARRILVPYAQQARAQMAVIELVGPRADPSFIPNVEAPSVAPALFLIVGPWLSLVHQYGSPALPIAGLPAQSEVVREAADALMVRVLRLRLVPIAARAKATCRVVRAGGAGIALRVPSGGIALRPDRSSPVELRRFADRKATAVGIAPAGRYVGLNIPRDPSTVPWQARLPAAARVSACRR